MKLSYLLCSKDFAIISFNGGILFNPSAKGIYGYTVFFAKSSLGFVSILIYLSLGVLGLPVFAGFRGGAAALLDATGGFLWGFAAGGLVYWLCEKLGKFPAMVLCQLTVYLCGCFWFSVWTGGGGVWAALLTCVIPYLIPDGIKLWLACRLSGRIGKHLHL